MKPLHIATSPLTNLIYAGTILKDGCTWAAGKQDVTGAACGAVAEHVVRAGRPIVVTCNGKPRFEIDVTLLNGLKGIYFASKVKHAPLWKDLRNKGVRTCSTWIDEAGEGETADYVELSERCIAEISRANAVLLYCEPGEILKGALIEVGIALANSIPVLCVGGCDSLSRVFRKHPLWHEFDSIANALNYVGEAT